MATPRLLFLQHDSVFENFGGLQYYIDDFINYAVENYGSEQVRAVLALRKPNTLMPQTSYSIKPVFFNHSALRKIENHFSPNYIQIALREIKQFNPTLLVASHIAFGPMTWLLSKISGIPYAVMVYGYEVWGDVSFPDKFALKRANQIITISRWTKNILIKEGYQENRITIVHPSLTEKFLDVVVKKDFSVQGQKLKLLTIARLDAEEQYKGCDHVLEALVVMKKLAPEQAFSYTIVGEGTDLVRLKDLASKLGLNQEVSFLPKVKDRYELESIYRKHDLFIMPSRFGRWKGKWRGEGFGIVYVEAAAFGIPSIAYNCGGVTDIIESGRNGILVEPDNKKALADAINEFALDRDKLLSLGVQARENALSRFAPTIIKRQILDCFSV